MKQIILIILSVLVLNGCHTGKITTNLSAEKRDKSVADSIKYAAVKDAFTKGEFVFKISNIDGKSVNAADNWLLFSDGRVRYQTVRFTGMEPPYSKIGDINGMELTHDPKKKTITMTGSAKNVFQIFTVTLFEGSDKADGHIEPIESTGKISYINRTIEGWIEPLNDATIVRGEESIFYK